MNKIVYPLCLKNFQKFLKSESKYLNIYNEILKKPQVFDVSLRDGLQFIEKSEVENYYLERKKDIYYNILETHQPKHMEIGSFASHKILPIFKDTPELFKSLEIDKICENGLKPDFYIFIPTFEKLMDLEKNYKEVFQFCNNFSLTASCSYGFQMKNIQKTLNENKNDLHQILKFLNSTKGTNNFKIKLYVSCINECPINGKMDLDFIIEEIMYYYMNYKLDNLCLSDTLGTLSPKDFETIMQKCLYLGINSSFLSLHIHFKEGDEEDEKRVEKLINVALRCKIPIFDVSELKTGGCPLLPEKNLVKSNLTYEVFYKCLVNNIISISKYSSMD